MCKICTTRYFENLLNETRSQVFVPNSNSLSLRLDILHTCTESHKIDTYGTVNGRTLSFPGSSQRESLTFTVMLRLCGIILANLKMDRVVTIRDIYYQDTMLFRRQSTVFRSIEQLTRYLRVSRLALNITPSPNGLVAGDLTIALTNGDLLEVKRSNGASLIPVNDILYVSAKRVPHYILLVEKEAVFSYLQAELLECIIITGKGFPDRATRNLIYALRITYPQTPIYGVVDSDPHGILILKSYEDSAQSMAKQAPIDIDYLGISLLDYQDGLVPYTANDIIVARSTLRKDWINSIKYKDYKTELQRGLFMRMKGEMNLMDADKSKRLSMYIREKIGSLRYKRTDFNLGSQGWSSLTLTHLSCTSQMQPSMSLNFNKRVESTSINPEPKRKKRPENISLSLE